jgi:hypothetical protein
VANSAASTTASTISSVASDMAIDGAVSSLNASIGNLRAQAGLVQSGGGGGGGGTVQEALLASTIGTSRNTVEQLEPLDRMNATQSGL